MTTKRTRAAAPSPASPGPPKTVYPHDFDRCAELYPGLCHHPDHERIRELETKLQSGWCGKCDTEQGNRVDILTARVAELERKNATYHKWLLETNDPRLHLVEREAP